MTIKELVSFTVFNISYFTNSCSVFYFIRVSKVNLHSIQLLNRFGQAITLA